MKDLEEKIVYDSDHFDLFKTDFKTVGTKHPSWRVHESSNCYTVCRIFWDVYKNEETKENVATFVTLEKAMSYINCQIAERS